MYGSNEAAASGIVQGSQETGKDVTVVGFDSGKTQIDAIKGGTEAGAVTQSPVKIGYYTVKAAVAALNGGELPTVIDSGLSPGTTSPTSTPTPSRPTCTSEILGL